MWGTTTKTMIVRTILRITTTLIIIAVLTRIMVVSVSIITRIVLLRTIVSPARNGMVKFVLGLSCIVRPLVEFG